MKKLLVLLNRLDIEGHLPEIIEITKTHGVVRVYLAKASPEFGSRVRTILPAHKLDMAARMGDMAVGRYLAQIADTLRKRGIDCDYVSTGIPAKKLDDFMKSNGIDLVLSSDGRSGLCCWPGGGLSGRHAQFLYEHALTDEKIQATGWLIRKAGSQPGMKKMLVLLNRLDIDQRLPELRDMVMTLGVQEVHLATVSQVFSSGSRGMTATREMYPVKQVMVYLARISRGFSSRVRSIVSPQKLDTAVRMSDAAANRYLSRMADALKRDGVDVIPVGIGIPLDKVKEYIEKNDVALAVIGDGRTGLRYWPDESCVMKNIQAGYGYELRAETDISERPAAKTRYWIGTACGITLLFGVLFTFWLVLSGHYQLKFIISGVAMAGLVTLLTYDLVLSVFRHDREKKANLFGFSQIRSFLAYLPWLLAKIVVANLQIAYLVLHPRMPIAPALLRFQTRLQNNLARVILANSITLTPGTITVSLKNGEYIVHSLVPSSAGDILEARLQNKVGEIFTEGREEPPAVIWAHSLREMEL